MSCRHPTGTRFSSSVIAIALVSVGANAPVEAVPAAEVIAAFVIAARERAHEVIISPAADSGHSRGDSSSRLRWYALCRGQKNKPKKNLGVWSTQAYYFVA